MYQIVREGLEAGALGFSTSRTMGHKAVDGEPVPGTFAQEDELFGIGRALADTGKGVFELAGAGAAGDAGGDGADDAAARDRVDAPPLREDRAPGLVRDAAVRFAAGPVAGAPRDL